MRRRPLVLAVQAAVVLALIVGAAAYVILDKSVTLTVDGEEREVRTFAATVGEVLDDEGIAVGDKDLVVPRPEEGLEDGAEVQVRFARPVTLTVDGEEREVWVTARTVEEALAQVGVRDEGAFVSASRSSRIGREGIELELRTPKEVSVRADGATKTLTTTQPTVGGVLEQAGLRLGKLDRLTVGGKAATVGQEVTAGMDVAVARVVVKKETSTAAVPFATEEREDDDLYEGTSDVVRAGSNGTRTVVTQVTYVDGKAASKKVLSNKVTKAPVSKVVAVGTKERPQEQASRSSSGSSGSSSASVPSSGGLNWAALAECESGGNPRAVNPAGYYGLYQFSPSTWRSVGGSGNPADASVAEQTQRAQILYDRSGRGQWPHCGRYL